MYLKSDQINITSIHKADEVIKESLNHFFLQPFTKYLRLTPISM